jgi:hypothetical protein
LQSAKALFYKGFKASEVFGNRICQHSPIGEYWQELAGNSKEKAVHKMYCFGMAVL